MIDPDVSIPGVWVKFKRGKVYHHLLAYPGEGPIMTTCSKRFDGSEVREVRPDVPLLFLDRCRNCWHYLRGKVE